MLTTDQAQIPVSAAAEPTVPEGYERREIIWPMGEERISVLFPIRTDVDYLE